MSIDKIAFYEKIQIIDNHYSIICNGTEEQELEKLKKIEIIIRDNLNYYPITNNDKFAKFSKAQLWEKLKNEAEAIYSKYPERGRWHQLIYGVDREERQIYEIYNRIKDFLNFSLSCFVFLSVRELARLSCVNKSFNERVKAALGLRAIEYGKKSSDITPTDMYIKNLFDKISYIHKYASDKSFIVYRRNSNQLDCEKTLMKMGGGLQAFYLLLLV